MRLFGYGITVNGSVYIALLLGAVSCTIVTAYFLLRETAGSSTLFIVGGGYLLLVLAILLFTVNRFITNSSAMASIPKFYMPIQPEDLSYEHYKLISSAYERAKSIALLPLSLSNLPKYKQFSTNTTASSSNAHNHHNGSSSSSSGSGSIQDLHKGNVNPLITQGDLHRQKCFGWGLVGSGNEGINFKSAIASSFPLLHSIMEKRYPKCSRKSYQTVRQFLLQIGPKFSPPLNETIVKQYILYYERARFGVFQMTEVEYEGFMKIFVAMASMLETRSFSSS